MIRSSGNSLWDQVAGHRYLFYCAQSRLWETRFSTFALGAGAMAAWSRDPAVFYARNEHFKRVTLHVCGILYNAGRTRRTVERLDWSRQQARRCWEWEPIFAPLDAASVTSEGERGRGRREGSSSSATRRSNIAERPRIDASRRASDAWNWSKIIIPVCVLIWNKPSCFSAHENSN